MIGGKRVQQDDSWPTAGDIVKDFRIVADDLFHAAIIETLCSSKLENRGSAVMNLGIRDLLPSARMRWEHVRLFRHHDPRNWVRQQTNSSHYGRD